MEVREFSTSQSYSAGNLTIYEGKLYRFITSHSAGAWNSAEVIAVDQNEQQDLTRILTGMDNAEKAIAYAGTVIMEPALIEGTRYKYIMTNAPDPRNN